MKSSLSRRAPCESLEPLREREPESNKRQCRQYSSGLYHEQEPYHTSTPSPSEVDAIGVTNGGGGEGGGGSGTPEFIEGILVNRESRRKVRSMAKERKRQLYEVYQTQYDSAVTEKGVLGLVVFTE